MGNKRSATDEHFVNAAERRALVMGLRRAGVPFHEIAETVATKYAKDAEIAAEKGNPIPRLPAGWDERYAYKDVQRELERLNRDRKESTEAVRRIEIERLDRALRAIWSKVTAGDLGAIDRMLRIQDRRAKYEGLDAPTKLDLTWRDRIPPDQRSIADDFFAQAARQLADKIKHGDGDA